MTKASYGQFSQKDERKAEKRKKINALIRQAEEGTLVYTNIVCLDFRPDLTDMDFFMN